MINQKFELNDNFKAIIRDFENYSNHLFITGKAGTGKSSLINYIRRKTKKNLVILAPTAIAALNINAKTIHSFFNFPFHVLTKNDIKKHYNRRLINKIDSIIIDEVSMLRPDILDAINYTLQLTRDNEKPFGGIQIILVGDLFQLPPVITSDDIEVMEKLYPDGQFFFNSNIVNSLDLVKYELKKVYRQKDKILIELLDKARSSMLEDDDLSEFNKRVIMNDDEIPSEIITLSPTNNKVNNINSRNLKNLKKNEFSYEAEQDGSFSGNPVAENLKLKVGAQVMLTKNGKNWVNGTLAIIDKLTKNNIYIQLKDEIYKLEKEKWEKFNYKISDNKIIPSVSATFIQYPLKLAWAATIHKCQGQTFENVIIDMDYGAFAHGQTYVALSRVVSLKGLYLRRALTKNDFIFNQEIQDFLN
jgi:ATP-dependent exoDNAse (exonuclease V) alpha subunit